MQTWTVAARAEPASALDVGHVAAALMRALGTPRFGASLLDGISAAIGAGSMCAWRVSNADAPVRYCSASHEDPDRTGSCWTAYRDGIYRADETFDAIADRLGAAADDGPVGDCTIGHLTVDDVRYPPHRERIYDRHALLARLTVAGREPNGDLLAVNFYHHRDQGWFDDRALARFEALARPVLEAVRRHHALADAEPAAPTAPTGRIDRIAHFDARLAARAPTLTVRERAVCARLLAGMLYAGIASDLGVTLPTVKTYRGRAFDRLGIHFRNELFALVDDGR